MRIPASAASDDPRAHPSILTREGAAPYMAARSGESTTARRDTPARVRNRNSRRPTAMAAATATTVSWW